MSRLFAITTTGDGHEPPLFEQLVELAGKLDPQPGLCAKPEADTAAEVEYSLRGQYLKVFQGWLCLTLEEQMSDLSRYLVASGQNRVEVARRWLNDRSYLRLIPPRALQLQKELFMMDLEVVLEIQSSTRPDCHSCERSLNRMLESLKSGFMRINTLALAQELYAEVPNECRQYCLSHLGRAITTLEAGEFTNSWRNLSVARVAIQSRTGHNPLQNPA
jgi:hypothetical protein